MTAPNGDSPARVRESFARQGMMRTLGAELREIARGRVVISAPITSAVAQQHGYGHAGLTFAIGDSAAGYAALSLAPPGREVLTSEMKINLIAPADGERLEAVGTVLREGRKLTTVQADIYAIRGESRSHVAVMLGTIVSVRTQDRE